MPALEIPSDPIRRALAVASAAATRTLTPLPEIETLRTATASGFRNVYAHRGAFVAKVKEGGRLLPIPGSRSFTPHQAAAFVVAYYRVRFGPHWREALARRQRLYWRAWRGSSGAWYLIAWVRGVPRFVKTQNGMRRRFRSRTDAARWAKCYLRKTVPLWRA